LASKVCVLLLVNDIHVFFEKVRVAQSVCNALLSKLLQYRFYTDDPPFLEVLRDVYDTQAGKTWIVAVEYGKPLIDRR